MIDINKLIAFKAMVCYNNHMTQTHSDTTQIAPDELRRRYYNAVASHEIEGFTYTDEDHAFFEKMITDGLTQEQMIERVRQRHSVSTPLAAE